MNRRFVSIILAVLLLNSCKKDEGQPAGFENNILGNWSVVDAANEPITVEWGLFYVSTTKLYADKSFKVNLGTGPDTSGSRTGTWRLNENKDSIVFYSDINIPGAISRDTTEFNISIDSKDRLILKNAGMTIAHIRLNN